MPGLVLTGGVHSVMQMQIIVACISSLFFSSSLPYFILLRFEVVGVLVLVGSRWMVAFALVNIPSLELLRLFFDVDGDGYGYGRLWRAVVTFVAIWCFSDLMAPNTREG